MSFYRIRPKSGTVTQWEQANTVLAEREIGYELPSEGLGKGLVRMKMGDGVTPWNELPYAVIPVNLYDGEGNLIYDIPITPNPNILVNSDFQSGIINQKNATSYSNGGVYTIDMWQILGCGRLALKNENDVQFWRNDTVGGIAQFRQILESTVTGTHTFTVNLKAVTSKVQMYILNSSNEMIKQYVKVGVNTLTYTGSIKEVGMLIEEGDNESCYFNYLKLEKGDHFTGMPLWDRCLELLKCKRFFQIINYRVYCPQFYQNQYVGFKFEVEMRKIPTVSNVQLINSSDSSKTMTGTITVINNKNVDKFFAPSTYTNPMVILNRAFFDAYEY